MELSKIVKKYRVEHHLTQQELADRAGVSKGYISMIERGKDYRTGTPITPTIETVKKLAYAMQIPASELLKMLDMETMTPGDATINMEECYEAVALHNGVTVEELKSALDLIKKIKK